MTKYFIAWNANRTEGYITDTKADAISAKSGRPNRASGFLSMPTLGEAFHKSYGGGATIQPVDIPSPTARTGD